jgi:hypothetical protein
MATSLSLVAVCEVHSRLRRLYALAQSNYEDVIETRIWRIQTLRDPNPEPLRHTVETAQKIMEEAREALERHAAEHGC